MILERNETRLARNKKCIERKETKGGNLLLSGTVVCARFKDIRTSL